MPKQRGSGERQHDGGGHRRHQNRERDANPAAQHANPQSENSDYADHGTDKHQKQVSPFQSGRAMRISARHLAFQSESPYFPSRACHNGCPEQIPRPQRKSALLGLYAGEQNSQKGTKQGHADYAYGLPITPERILFCLIHVFLYTLLCAGGYCSFCEQKEPKKL